MSSENLHSQLRAAWELRMDQRQAECRELAETLCTELQLTAFLADAQGPLTLSEPDLALRADVLCLVASLHRASGKLADAEGLLSSVRGAVKAAGKSPTFALYFQMATNALCRGHHSEALDLFVHAGALARSAEDKIYALSNTLLCLECLGQPYQKVLAELRSELAAVPPLRLKGVRQQFRAFDARDAFRSGDFARLFSAEPDPEVDQSFHISLLCSELPYHTFHAKFAGEEKERFFTQNPHLYKKAYRLRTLQGTIHPNDFEELRGSDFADRLYLWTWRWLTNPVNHPMESLLILMEGVDLESLSTRLTQEDCYLVRNSLLWIALFNPLESKVLESAAASIRASLAYPGSLLEYEQLLVSYLLLLRDGAEAQSAAYQALVSHPLAKSKVIRQNSLLGGAGFAPLSGLRQRIKALVPKAQEFKKGYLYVDLPRAILSWDGGRKREISEPLCQALALLKRKECVSFEELTEVCFGLSRFDAFIHNAKVYNLLARLKKALPADLSLRTKHGRIFVQGNWRRVEICGDLPPSARHGGQPWRACFERNRQRTSLEKNTNAPLPSLVMVEKTGDQLLSRTDLQKATGKSRATANRIIHSWLVRGIVKKVGQAKNTRYVVLAPLD